MSRLNDIWSDPQPWPHCDCPMPQSARRPAPGECWCVQPKDRFLSDKQADLTHPILSRVQREHRPQWSRPKWVAVEVEVRARDANSCRHCGQSGGYLVIDHIIPLARGGFNTMENFQLLCDQCNGRKGCRLEITR